jgi:hypothetical protein
MVDARIRAGLTEAKLHGRDHRSSLRRAGEITRWVADSRARRVPTFVIDATGLDTKKKIVAKYDVNAAFEKGKSLPPAARSEERSGAESSIDGEAPVVRKKQKPRSDSRHVRDTPFTAT